METKSQQNAVLCEYLEELGLKGLHWYIGDNEALLDTRILGKIIRKGPPASPEALDQCSVLILETGKNLLIESTLTQLESTNIRPVIILVGENSLANIEQDRLRTLGYQLPPTELKDRPFRIIEHAQLNHKKYFDVARYWEKRYASGRNSGSGSYGRLAHFKAQFLNQFVIKNEIKSVVEFGCGDGAQLALAEYPQYIGLDISPTVIENCKRIFEQDKRKQFIVYDPERFDPLSIQVELGLSLDVIYHLSNDEVYQAYLDHLFAASSHFVIIYSNSEQGSRSGVNDSAGYVRFRDVVSDVQQSQPEWTLASATPNRFPFSTLSPSNTSFADFFVFEKQQEGKSEKTSTADLERFNTEKILNTLRISDENTKCISEDVETANKKIDKLTSKIQQLDNTRKLQAQLDQVHKNYSDACQNIIKLQEEIGATSEKYQEASAQYHTASAKYRDANTKYRNVSQQLSALKSSPTYKAGLYVKAASSSFVDAVKLPVRLWRLKKPSKNQTSKRMDIHQGLRYIKWKMVVPFATKIGIPYSKVAHISLPQSAKKIIERDKHQTSAQQTLGRMGASQQPETFTPPSAAAQEISILGWPEQPPNGKPYVMGIMDEFTSGCFEQDVNLIQPRPDNWYALAEKYQPEFIFIESAWKGNLGSWQYRVADYANKPGREVEHICQYARGKGIPTLFWNKEDPVHHEKFMCSAKLVDHIFTTDANMKESYQAKTGNFSVHALPFAAQPALHKPAPLAGRKPRACFAGSWYGNRHAERGEAMRWLLEAANQHGLDIYDRNYGTGIFPFPEEYQNGIKGSLPYKELCDEYSHYRVFLNVNSVTDSPTMFSRRVFELMACGTPVVSTYAKGIEKLFDSDAVWMVNSQEEADAAIHTLMTDDAEWRRRSLAGIREVFTNHTYNHRLNDIFEKLSIDTRIHTDPSILLIAEAKNQAELEALKRFAQHQSYRDFCLGIECQQGIESHGGLLDDNVVLLQPGERTSWLNEQQTKYPLAGWLSPHGHYGEYYLRDLANASLYEPEAIGWAKSPEQDCFAYGEPALLVGALWKTSEFVVQYINYHHSDKPNASVQGLKLFVIDSDQFQPAVKELEEGEGKS